METRNVFDVLNERGFIKQTTHEEEIKELLGKEKVTFYIGFDPTADSLHVGHFIPVMTMIHMQRHGHIPVALVGGGTTMVGDPSGRSDMRNMMTKENIMENGMKFKETFGKFIDFSEGKAILDNNADWLLDLNYVDFLRGIGKHFSVNRMLTADCYKQRLETGLTFLEFNYMIMQSYDFLELYRRHNCKMQCGGDDQWSNILGGVDLIRREEGAQAYGMTFKLLTTKDGIKMGKTQKGAVWLDPNKTSPYEFFQYWRNVDDQDVENCLNLLTFLPLEDIAAMVAKDADINKAKETLAFEVTQLVHGTEEAQKALEAAKALFGGGADLNNVPKTLIAAGEFEGEGKSLITLLTEIKLVPSRSEGMRTIEQGGLSVDDIKITDNKFMVKKEMFKDGRILIRKGKKTYHLVELQ